MKHFTIGLLALAVAAAANNAEAVARADMLIAKEDARHERWINRFDASSGDAPAAAAVNDDGEGDDDENNKDEDEDEDEDEGETE